MHELIAFGGGDTLWGCDHRVGEVSWQLWNDVTKDVVSVFGFVPQMGIMLVLVLSTDMNSVLLSRGHPL